LPVACSAAAGAGGGWCGIAGAAGAVVVVVGVVGVAAAAAAAGLAAAAAAPGAAGHRRRRRRCWGGWAGGGCPCSHTAPSRGHRAMPGEAAAMRGCRSSGAGRTRCGCAAATRPRGRCRRGSRTRWQSSPWRWLEWLLCLFLCLYLLTSSSELRLRCAWHWRPGRLPSSSHPAHHVPSPSITLTSAFFPSIALGSLGNADGMGVVRSSSRSAACDDSTQAAVFSVASQQPLQDDSEHRHHCPH
jgi:hypothetical protein